MIMIYEFIALLSCTIFAGAAIYINVSEHPARLECGSELAATVFGPSYHRAARMQASLAVIATISGIAVGIEDGGTLWYVGALLIFSVIPFTFVVIMPTNKQLLDTNLDKSSETTLTLLKRWGYLHGFRSLLSTVAAMCYTYASIAT